MGAARKKKVVKKFWGIGQKISRGAANLNSAPGGRHPSYATDSHKVQSGIRHLWFIQLDSKLPLITRLINLSTRLSGLLSRLRHAK